MIRIERPPTPPDILQRRGKQETKNNCECHDCRPRNYNEGARRLKFHRKIYAHRSVKDTLLQAQHRKCCYCESKFLSVSRGEVEHFRPKGAVRQCRNQRMEYPGYYWLAYCWSNLLVSCHECNTSKHALFPLVDDTVRARSHHDDVGAERPLFVDPAREDPRCHIRFRGEEVIAATERGCATIQGMDLQRCSLEEERRERLAFLKTLALIVKMPSGEIPDDEVENARCVLAKAVLPGAKFSSMAQDFLDAKHVMCQRASDG